MFLKQPPPPSSSSSSSLPLENVVNGNIQSCEPSNENLNSAPKRQRLSSTDGHNETVRKSSSHLVSMVKRKTTSTIGTTISNDHCCSDNDLTNLNWLQDVDLLKKVYLADNNSDNNNNRNDPSSTRKTLDKINNNSNNCDQWQNLLIHQTTTRSSHELCEKPPYSYSALIFMAIESSNSKCMMVRDIYKWIINNYPYFSMAPSGWKNTIRHTLSLRKCFKKIDTNAQTSSSPSSKKDPDVKGGYWYVDPEYRSILQQQVIRITNTMAINNKQQPTGTNQTVAIHQIKRTHFKDMITSGHSPPIRTIGDNVQSNLSSNLSPTFERYDHKGPTQLIKMNSSYFVFNPNSVRFDNSVSGNIYRNLVSVISVNQAPKLYAPVPMLSKPNDKPRRTNTSKRSSCPKHQHQQRKQPYFNLLKDKQNVVCSNCNHLATSGFNEAKHELIHAQATMVNHGVSDRQSLKYKSQHQHGNSNTNHNNNVWKFSTSTSVKHNTNNQNRRPNNQTLGDNSNNKNNENQDHHGLTSSKTTPQLDNTGSDDEQEDGTDDGMHKDGAQALLNFASRSFIFNLIN